MPRWLVIMGGILAMLAVALLWSARLGGLDEHERARRVLLWNGVLCTPKIVDRVEEGVLRVVCADGKHELVVQPSCDESLACAWGIDVACWDHEPWP